MNLKDKIKSNPTLKRLSLWMLNPQHDPRPRWWVRTFVNFIKNKKGRGAIIRSHARMDIFPYNIFSLGKNSIVEDFCVINNAVGDVKIGDNSIVGISSVVIGPIEIKNNVMLAQHVVLSGLNHGYKNVDVPPIKQKVECKQITIEDNVWIGANSVITAGITIGKHSIVGAGSIVTKNVEPYTVVVGNPAKAIRKYNFNTGVWENV
jgi:Acetyltransferase (isoleucine patch superfamily)